MTDKTPLLRSQLIRLAHARPDLRADLLPLLKESSKKGPVTVSGNPGAWEVSFGPNHETFSSLKDAKAFAKKQCLPGEQPELIGRAGWANPSGQLPRH